MLRSWEKCGRSRDIDITARFQFPLGLGGEQRDLSGLFYYFVVIIFRLGNSYHVTVPWSGVALGCLWGYVVLFCGGNIRFSKSSGWNGLGGYFKFRSLFQ